MTATNTFKKNESFQEIEPFIVQIGNKKHEIKLDKKIVQHFEKLQNDPNDFIEVKFGKVRQWCRDTVSKKKELIKDLDKIANDCLDKNFFGVTYEGKHAIDGVKAPRFDNFLVCKPRYVEKPYAQNDVENISVPDGFKAKEIHPDADIFPYINSEDFDALVHDIKTNGQMETIKLLDGKIIDGRNRYKACLAAGKEPKFEDIKVEDSLQYVLSINNERRHLSESQRAWIAAKLYQRSLATKTPLHQIQAANLMNVSRRSMIDGQKVLLKSSPELKHAVEYGKIAVSSAAEACKYDAKIQKDFLKVPPSDRRKFLATIKRKTNPNKNVKASISFTEKETQKIREVMKLQKIKLSEEKFIKELVLKQCEEVFASNKQKSGTTK